jgi:hypothetical protein
MSQTRQPWEDKFEAFAPLVMASTQIIGPLRSPVCFAYRTNPNNQYDSGWVFFSGKESPEFLADAANASICPLRAFVEMDSSLLDIVDSPLGSVWERHGSSSS